MSNPPSGSVTASVGAPAPLAERPTYYLVIYSDGRSWEFGTPKADRAQAEVRHKEAPGSVLVTIPGSASPPAPPSELVLQSYRVVGRLMFADTPMGTPYDPIATGPVYLASAVDARDAAKDARIAELEQKLATNEAAYNEAYMNAHAQARKIIDLEQQLAAYRRLYNVATKKGEGK